MTQDNSRYISGEWYEHEYSHGWYRNQYITNPLDQWARESNRFIVDCMIAFTGINREAKILDLGSGVGHLISAWKERGFYRVYGIEISETAVRESHNPNIFCGSVADMPFFKDQEFELVTSVALLEHIDVSQEDQTMKEILRVGQRQAHSIGLEAGSDPGHINIKTMPDWMELMSRHASGMVSIINCPITYEPVLVNIPEKKIIHPLQMMKWNYEAKVKGEITI